MNMPVSTAKQSFSLAPQSIDEALRFAEMRSKSSLVPKDFSGNPGNILVAVQWGMELGLQPMQAMQNIAVINGRPSLWGEHYGRRPCLNTHLHRPGAGPDAAH